MKRMFGRGRYANVTATLALIVALGGTSYAAVSLPHNSVGTSQIKKHGVHNSDIASNAVTSGKVKNNSLTGSDIKESKLGTVPRATFAGSATNATNATNAGHATSATSATSAVNAVNAVNAARTAGVTIFTTQRVAAAADFASAPKVDLATRGTLHFYGKCYVDSGYVYADEYIEVTSGSAVFGTEGFDDSTNLTPTTDESDRLLNESDAGPDSIADNDTDSDFRAATSDVALTGNVGLALAKQGSPVTGDGPFPSGDSCIFGGSVFG